MKDKFIILFIFIAGLFSQSAGIYVFDEHVDIVSNGIVSGVQMKLTHDDDFSIALEPFYISEYMTQDNSTLLVIVSESNVGGQLFSYSGDMSISEIIVAMSTNLGIEEVLPTITYESDCDINNDNNVNVVDVVLLVNMIFDDTEFGSDINQDGAVNVVDIVAMINLIFYESFLDDDSEDCIDVDDDGVCDDNCTDLDEDSICDDEDDCVVYNIVFDGICTDEFGNDIECSEDMFDCPDSATPGSMQIDFSLSEASEIHLYLKDECSNIFTIEQGYYSSGYHTFIIDGESYQTGWYELTIEWGTEVSTQAIYICNPPSLEDLLIGIWQLDRLAIYSGQNCDVLEEEYFGPNFNIGLEQNNVCVDLNDTYNQECSSGVNIYLSQIDCEAAGFEWEYDNCEYCLEDVSYGIATMSAFLDLSQQGSYLKLFDHYENGNSYYNSDISCDGIFNYCNSEEIIRTDRNFEYGNFDIQQSTDELGNLVNNFLTFYNNSYLHLKNGTRTECNGCEEDESCDEIIYDNCITTDTFSDTEQSVIEELSENHMHLKTISTYQDYYNQYYNNDPVVLACIEWEYNKIDSLSIGGCTLNNYTNYNPHATFNDGTCSNNICPGFYPFNSSVFEKINLIK